MYICNFSSIFSWIALLQPILMSLLLVIFRQHWLGQQLQSKDFNGISNADIEEIKNKLTLVEKNALSSKDINGIEESISDLYKSFGMLQEQAGKYSQVNQASSRCDGQYRLCSSHTYERDISKFGFTISLVYMHLSNFNQVVRICN